MRISLKKWKQRQFDKKVKKEQVKFAKTKWHSWFAWHPIGIEDEIMFLEVIHRRYDPYADAWRYKHLMDILKDGH